MIEERKPEEFEDDRKKWRIYFDLEIDKMRGRGDSNILVSFAINKKGHLEIEDIQKLKQDLKDLGKIRIIKQGKTFLDNGK